MQQGKELLAAQTNVAAALSAFSRNEEGVLTIGKYDAVHRRVEPQFAQQAISLGEQIRLRQIAGKRTDRMVRQLVDLPRFVVNNYVAHNLVTDVGAKLLLDTTRRNLFR